MFFSHGLVDQQQRGNPWFHPCIKLIIFWGSDHPSLRAVSRKGQPILEEQLEEERQIMADLQVFFRPKMPVLLLCVFLRWFWNKPKRLSQGGVLCPKHYTHLVGGLELTHIFIYFSGGVETTNQWIGLRENLQESPIFNGKIYGFL